LSKNCIELSHFAELVDRIYQSAYSPREWVESLNAIRQAFRSTYATLIVRPVSGHDPGLMVNAGLADGQGGGVVPAIEYYSAQSPFIGMTSQRIFTVQDLMSEETWVRSDYYQTWCAPRGVHHILGVNLQTLDTEGYRLRLTRARSDAAFSDLDRQLLALLIPHLQRALHLQTRLDTSEQVAHVYGSAIGSLSVGTVTLDITGRVLQMNSIARAQIDAGDALKISNERLHALNNQDNRELQRMVQEAASHANGVEGPVGAVSVTRNSSPQGLGVIVQRLGPTVSWLNGRHQPAIVLFLRDPEIKTQPPSKVIQQLFHFTPAETTLAIELANGLSLDEAAELLNIRRNTARAHLRSIFSKTGVRRQTELVRLILNSVVSLGHQGDREPELSSLY
jgi:DNA-binding CsgD family transcriptional regulator/PAS domain-containing protein